MAVLDTVVSVATDFFIPGGHFAYFRIFVALIAVYFIVNKILNIGRYSKYPPTAKGTYVPWLGHMFAFGTDPVGFFVKQANEVGEIVSFTLFGRDCVMLISNEGQKAFYEAPEEVLNTAKTYKFTVPCFGPNVVYDAPDHKFQQHRKMAGTALTVTAFKLYVATIEKEVNDFIAEKFPAEEGLIDFSQAINELTVLTSTACLQGPEIRAQVHTGYSALIAALDHALSSVGFFFPGLPLPTYIQRDKARRQLGSMFSQILKQRRQAGFKGTDVMQVLMDSRYEDGTPLTDEEVVGNLIALMMAGQHTSNITSSWLMLNVLSRPDVRDKILAEQKTILGDLDVPLTYDMVKEMNYLHNCVKETLRLTPPIIVIWRTVEVPFQYKEYVIPKDTLVMVAPSAYPRTKFSVYSEPREKFDPDRFSAERGEDRLAPYSYFSFSAGRHSCVGEKFAYLQIKTIFSILVRRFDIELVGQLSDYPADNTSLLAAPKGPIMLKYKRRHY